MGTEANFPEIFPESNEGIFLVSEANEHLDSLKLIWVDSGYSGANFARAISRMPPRWVVERTFPWILQNRRLIVDQ